LPFKCNLQRYITVTQAGLGVAGAVHVDLIQLTHSLQAAWFQPLSQAECIQLPHSLKGASFQPLRLYESEKLVSKFAFKWVKIVALRRGGMGHVARAGARPRLAGKVDP
jgi:hypothetical protein